MLGRLGRVRWKKKPDNWPKVNKDLEELTYIRDLTASSLRPSSLGRTPTAFLSGCASLPCFCLNYTLFLCVLLHLLLRYVSNNKLCTCFYSFCLLEKCIFHWGKGPGGLVARIPGFHPGYPGSIPGQGNKICCLSEITIMLFKTQF